MARVIVIGGIESTYHHVQTLHEMGEDIVMFYTRGPASPGWQGVKLIDETQFACIDQIPLTRVNGHINAHFADMQALKPDVIYSLGWQQIYSPQLLSLCKVVGIHESLLPHGAGAVPIANAILHGNHQTGATLFWLDVGTDTGPMIGQLKSRLDPRVSNATELYQDAIKIGATLLRMYVPHINAGTAPAIAQDLSKRLAYHKVNWSDWPQDLVQRARVYPYA